MSFSREEVGEESKSGFAPAEVVTWRFFRDLVAKGGGGTGGGGRFTVAMDGRVSAHVDSLLILQTLHIYQFNQ